jgi:1,4-alpha-glucan branching enzyme
MGRGRAVIILHSHLPYVLGQGDWPHGEAWLYEAAFESYLPLLQACERLAADGIRPALTIQMSPVLGEQLDDERFAAGFAGYLEAQITFADRNAATAEATGDGRMAATARHWSRLARGAAEDFAARGGDLLSGFAALAGAGQIELCTTARTHGFLPLLGSADRVRAQVDGAVAWHRHRFGTPPAGFWMPECAYRPSGPWEPVTEGPSPEPDRPGNETFLANAGIEWTLVDTHLVAGGDPLGSYPARDARVGEGSSPYRVHRIAGSPVACLARDPRTTLQVWSGEWGYPGNPWYLEFHKKHHEGGLRYWRVTGKDADLGAKEPYDPDRAAVYVAEQADHFAGLVAGVLAGAADTVEDPVVVSPYDTELLGHWWHEGVAWLEAAIRSMASKGVEMATATEAVHSAEAAGAVREVHLPPGSWGDGGDFRVWDNPATHPLWGQVYRIESLLETTVRRVTWEPDGDLAAVLDQMERSALAAEGSDWPFLVTTRGAPDYAAERVARHLSNVERLAAMAGRLIDGGTLSPEDETLLRAAAERTRVWLP